MQPAPRRKRESADYWQRHFAEIERDQPEARSRRAPAGLQNQIQRLHGPLGLDAQLAGLARQTDGLRTKRAPAHPQQPREIDTVRRGGRRIEHIERIDQCSKLTAAGRRGEPGHQHALAPRGARSDDLGDLAAWQSTWGPQREVPSKLLIEPR
jgi:hypothetical protein